MGEWCTCRDGADLLPAPTVGVLLDVDCPIHGEQARRLVVDAIDHGRLIQAEPPGRCELCGAVAETRPYGPNGEEVCFPCGMKNEAAAQRAFAKRMGHPDA